MSSACLPSPSLTDNEVNVHNEWGGVERTAQKEKITIRPRFCSSISSSLPSTLLALLLLLCFFRFSLRSSGSVGFWLLSKERLTSSGAKNSPAPPFLPDRRAMVAFKRRLPSSGAKISPVPPFLPDRRAMVAFKRRPPSSGAKNSPVFPFLPDRRAMVTFKRRLPSSGAKILQFLLYFRTAVLWLLSRERLPSSSARNSPVPLFLPDHRVVVVLKTTSGLVKCEKFCSCCRIGGRARD